MPGLKKSKKPNLLDIIIEAAQAKKGEAVQAIKVTEVFPLADFLVLTSGKNTIHLKTLAKEIEEKTTQKLGILPRREGLVASRWLILDYGDIIVHIMGDAERKYYQLEKIWPQSPITNYY